MGKTFQDPSSKDIQNEECMAKSSKEGKKAQIVDCLGLNYYT
jgi:hypothetical protein